MTAPDLSASSPAGNRSRPGFEAAIEAAAKAEHHRQAEARGSNAEACWATDPEMFRRSYRVQVRESVELVYELIAASVAEHLAELIESDRDSDGHYELCSLTEAAALIRSFAASLEG